MVCYPESLDIAAIFASKPLMVVCSVHPPHHSKILFNLLPIQCRGLSIARGEGGGVTFTSNLPSECGIYPSERSGRERRHEVPSPNSWVAWVALYSPW